VSRVTQLAPTNGISDPHVRAFCDSLANAWGLRNGEINNEGGDRFITKAEFEDEVATALRGLIGSERGVGVPGFPSRPAGGAGGAEFPPGWTVEAGYRELAESVRRSWLWQHLGERFLRDDLIPYISGKISPLENVSEAAIKRAGAAEAGLATEITERVNNDGAFASVINTLWATFGGENQAIVQSGSTVAANPSAGLAQTWEQVQVAVADPATGAVSTIGILQSARAYGNAIDDTLRATWSVRTEVHSALQEPYVAGFGLTITGSRDPANNNYYVEGGPQSDFGVRADKFWIGSPNDQGNPNNSKNVPFIAVTGATTVDGVYYPEGGVWMNAAMICEATIDIAKIVKVIYSTNFNGTKDNTAGTVDVNNPGTTGWALGQDGSAVFSNVRIRGTSYVERLRVEGSTTGSFFLNPAASDGTVYDTHTHNENRNIQLTYWSDFGTPSIAYMDANSFSIRSVGYSGAVNIYWSYW
jgi:Domain of unknown function (DUF1983)